MRVLVFGDVMGRAGREALCAQLPELRKTYSADFVLVNGENAAHGFGITEAICRQFYESGVDVITTGNHVWDQREIIPYIEKDKRLLRPGNFPPGTPGRGAVVVDVSRGRRVLVLHMMARLFMNPLDDPFAWAERELALHPMKSAVQAVVVDFHGEATSEKMAMGQFLDGRVSLVFGTHSHIPTADAQILPQGTAYQTDLGMCGDYDSVIGMDKKTAVDRFVRKMPTERLTPAEGAASLCGAFLETDDASGRALRFAPVRLGGRLAESRPSP